MDQKERKRINKRRWRADNPERDREITRKALYKRSHGLTVDQYDNLIDKQGGRCSICGDVETKLSTTGTTFRLAVDHDHSTGKIRGLLCNRCNMVLGYCKDNVALLRSMASYIEHADTGLKITLNGLSSDDINSMSAEERKFLLDMLKDSESSKC